MDDLKWVVDLSDRSRVSLISTSRNTVSVGEIPKFVSALLSTRLYESNLALQAIRKGEGSI